ncbi:MAG: hypothetical protein JW751_08910 [Polyangiaceae bacterium]|nr:hypothetical protein [Polyangiaceae bacterium]
MGVHPTYARTRRGSAGEASTFFLRWGVCDDGGAVAATAACGARSCQDERAPAPLLRVRFISRFEGESGVGSTTDRLAPGADGSVLALPAASGHRTACVRRAPFSGERAANRRRVCHHVSALKTGRRCGRAGYGSALGLALLLSSGAGHTDDSPRLTLEYDAAEGCPAAADLSGSIDFLLGRPADQLLTEPLRVTVSVRELPPARYTLTLRIEPESRGGQRELLGARCDELVRAAAIIVALGINPQLRLDDDQPRARPDAGGPPAGTAGAVGELPPAPPRPAPGPAPDVRRRTVTQNQARASDTTERARWRLRAEGTATFEELPRPALGAILGSGFALDRWGLLVRGGFLGSQEKEFDAYGGKFRLAGGGLLACWHATRGRFWGAPCVDAELHWLWARGMLIRNQRTESRFIPELGTGAEAGFELRRGYSLVVSGLLLWPQQRPSFVVEEQGAVRPVHEIPPFGGRVGVGLELRP